MADNLDSDYHGNLKQPEGEDTFAASLGSALIEVARDDLRAVTEAVLNHWEEQYTCGSGKEVTVCRFCRRDQHYDYKKMCVPKPDHDLDCPVLVATSIAPNSVLDRQLAKNNSANGLD